MIKVGDSVRGYIHRNDGNHVFIAGEVVELYTVSMSGFDLPMAKVLRADTGRTAYVSVGHIEAIETRTAAEEGREQVAAWWERHGLTDAVKAHGGNVAEAVLAARDADHVEAFWLNGAVGRISRTI